MGKHLASVIKSTWAKNFELNIDPIGFNQNVQFKIQKSLNKVRKNLGHSNSECMSSSFIYNTFNFAAQPVTRQNRLSKVFNFDWTRSDGLRTWEPVTTDVEFRPVLTDPSF